MKLKKHKVIAKAFEKRKELNNGRLSISFASTHEDPLGKVLPFCDVILLQIYTLISALLYIHVNVKTYQIYIGTVYRDLSACHKYILRYVNSM